MKTRKVATFILYDKKSGKFLFQEKANYKPYKGWTPGGLSLFGGGVDKGEAYLQTAKREAMEELGYKLTKAKLFLIC